MVHHTYSRTVYRPRNTVTKSEMCEVHTIPLLAANIYIHLLLYVAGKEAAAKFRHG